MIQIFSHTWGIKMQLKACISYIITSFFGFELLSTEQDFLLLRVSYHQKSIFELIITYLCHECRVNEDIACFDVLVYDWWVECRVQVIHPNGNVTEHAHSSCHTVTIHVLHERFQTSVFKVIHHDSLAVRFVYDAQQSDNVL